MKLNRLLTVALIALVTALAIHVIYQLTESWKTDVTEDNMYSLTDGTRQILQKMADDGVKPIEIRLYFSETTGKSLPRFIKQFIVYHDYLRSLLKEYERASEGKLKVRFIDPVPDSDEAQDALDLGLDGKPINQHGDLFFFGLTFETETGSKDKIEFLWPNQQEDIEYEISKRIYSMLWPSAKRVGVISSLDVIANDDPYMRQLMQAQGRRPPDSWISMRLLQEQYKVAAIDKGTDHISHDDYDLLMVVHPRGLADRTLWAIDEWITTGGNTIIFEDPFSLDDQPPQNPQQPWAAMQYKPASDLNRITSAWGIQRVEDTVAADPDLGLRRPVARRGPAENVIVDLAVNEQNRASALDQSNPITRGLTSLRLFLAGQLTAADVPDGITVTPLITTTATGGVLPMKPGFGGQGGGLVFTDANNPAKLRDAFTSSDTPVVLAYLVSGKLGPAFPDGLTFPSKVQQPPPGMPPGAQMPPADDAEMITKEPVPEAERAEATVLVFADVDLISDQIAFQQSLFGPMAANDNHKLLLNAVDFLLGARELMNVRAKSSIARPFALFDEIEAKAETRSEEREKELRAEVSQFQEQVQSKQQELSQRNAALFEKKLQDEVDALNDRILEANRELREIRKQRRAALESEETWVRFSIMWMMPILMLLLGIVLFVRRRLRQKRHLQGVQR